MELGRPCGYAAATKRSCGIAAVMIESDSPRLSSERTAAP
jgi:hypothetical protein